MENLDGPSRDSTNVLATNDSNGRPRRAAASNALKRISEWANSLCGPPEDVEETLTLFNTFLRKLLFIVHCYVIVANAVSGCYFPLVSGNTRVKTHWIRYVSWPLFSH